MEVVFKEGMLYVKGNKFGKKTWRKTWIVLYPTSIFGIGRVEFHDILDGGHTTTKSKSTQCRRIVQLCDCLSVTLVPEESFAPALPNDDCRAFDLNTTQRRYILASENYHDWVGALCQLAFQKEPGHTETREKERGGGMGIPMEENELYATWKTAQYQVTVKTNEASRRCQLTGSYLLLPERDAILLQDLQTGVTVNCWPYHLLRRFGQVKGGFSIEAGRRCSSGEGQFTFMSKHAPQIYKAMEDALTLHREMENEDTKTSIQPPSNSSSPQLPHSSTSTHLPNNSSSPQLPHSSTSTHPPRNSSSPQLPHSSTSTHPPIKHRVHTRTDLSDRPTAPPLPMRNNLLHSPPIISPVTEQVPGSEPMADSDCDLYATIEDHLLPRMKHPPAPLRMQHSLHLYEEEEEEERCHSLDTVDLNKLRLGVGLGEGSPYYNLRRGITGRAEEEEEEERERESMVGSSQCIYALVNKPSETQPLSLAWSLPQPQTQSRSMPNLSRLQAQAQLQGEEEMGLRGSITPNQDPISFKQKLSDILGKDLAKFQQPLPPLATVTPRGSEY
ncbi:docking protein 3 isoform X2 [Oncorhynchus tshawytscha]|uniref:docking protein 3 isoform X2 n=1 Tax=Oncorhynchus tshawytscha TaxID=74940 RepID=UPI001C3DAB0C|nr:docking protein 3 isoform X2 [Oncorhynchus tshawytscha]